MESSGPNGFGEDVIHARGQHARLLADDGVGGQCEYRQIGLGLAYGLCGRVPVHYRHLQIHQDQIEVGHCRRCDRLNTVVGGDDRGAGEFDQFASNLAVEIVVIHQQDALADQGGHLILRGSLRSQHVLATQNVA